MSTTVRMMKHKHRPRRTIMDAAIHHLVHVASVAVVVFLFVVSLASPTSPSAHSSSSSTFFVWGFSPTTSSLSSLSVSSPRSSSSASSTSSHLSMALIYGWDDHDEDDDGKATTPNKRRGSSSSHQPPLYTTVPNNGPTSFFGSAAAAAECTTAGMYIAEHLTSDRDQMGKLAKLAFAFRGPEHSGLKLTDIETVHVLCVRETAMELEAILCENQGCVSLHIPIQFPTSCTSSLTGPSSDQFQSCVLQNIDQLDGRNDGGAVVSVSSSSSSSTVQATGMKSTGGAVEMKLQSGADDPSSISTQLLKSLEATTLDKSALPSWWVHPTNDEMAEECTTLREILNEDEFMSEMSALAQDGLRHSNQQDVQVLAARCAAVGPAGIGLKVLAKKKVVVGTDGGGSGNFGIVGIGNGIGNEDSSTVVMEVLYPFGGVPEQTARGLRAAVLGAVAVAAEQQQAVEAVAAVAAATATAPGGGGGGTPSSIPSSPTTTTTTSSSSTSTTSMTNDSARQPQPGNPPFW